MTKIGLPLLFLAAALSAVAAAPAARADSTGDPPAADRLVNIDTAATVDKGLLDGSVDGRFLGGRENVTFGSVSVRYGAAAHLQAGVRAVAGSNRSIQSDDGKTIRFGGSDVEVYGKYDLSQPGNTRWAVMAGVSFPNTPAQNDSALATLGAAGDVRLSDTVTAYVNPRAVFIDGNTIVGVGVGASIRVTDRVSVVGDWTAIATGDNTLSASDGSQTQDEVWGVALRVAGADPERRWDVDLGWSNGTGSTTGASLTPGLGGSSGFYLALRAHP